MNDFSAIKNNNAEKKIMSLSNPISILSTGKFIPEQIITNENLTKDLITSDEWIVKKTGITERRFVSTESTTDMCIAAAKQAIHEGEIDAKQLDAIIIASFTTDRVLPATSVEVKDAIGAPNALTIDMNQAACTGGLLGIMVGSHLLQNPLIKKVLVIGAESLSKFTDPTDRTTRVFFGDAAGAVILQQDNEGYNRIAWDMGTELSYEVELAGGAAERPTSIETLQKDNHFLKMQGKIVWEMATKHLPLSINSVINSMGVTADEIEHYLIHQANLNIINDVFDTLNQPISKTTINVHELGNTGAATILTVLDQAIKKSSFSKNDNIIFAAIGAGFIWGAIGFQKIS